MTKKTVLNTSKYLGYFFFLIGIPLFPFDDSNLNKIITNWEKHTMNKAIVIITNPESGKIEYAHTKESAFHRKLPAGSILKALSSFVFLANSHEFPNISKELYHCNGRFEEPYKGFFKPADKEKYNLIEDKKTGIYYFRCSTEKGHGKVELKKALAVSCNSYYLHHASKNSHFFYQTLLRDWNLKEGTGASFEKITAKTNSFPENQTEFESTLSSIGEGGNIRLTAVKIAQLYGAILTDTPLLKPILKGETPSQISSFPFPDNARHTIQKALRLTVKEGTLKDLKLQNTSIKILAGKSGTPTQEGKKFITHGWNIIFFKKNDTDYLLVLFVEKGNGKREAMELSRIILNSI